MTKITRYEYYFTEFFEFFLRNWKKPKNLRNVLIPTFFFISRKLVRFVFSDFFIDLPSVLHANFSELRQRKRVKIRAQDSEEWRGVLKEV